MTSIELSSQDAALFVSFQKNYDTFMTLKDSGVFDIRNGTAVLNFDNNGTLTDIDCNFKLYKKGKPVIVALQVIK